MPKEINALLKQAKTANDEYMRQSQEGTLPDLDVEDPPSPFELSLQTLLGRGALERDSRTLVKDRSRRTNDPNPVLVYAIGTALVPITAFLAFIPVGGWIALLFLWRAWWYWGMVSAVDKERENQWHRSNAAKLTDDSTLISLHISKPMCDRNTQ